LLAIGVLYATFVEDLTGDPRPCPLHGASHTSKYVRIRYGLLKRRPVTQEYIAAAKEFFPRPAPEFQSGGCTRGREIWAKVLYCSKCEKARQEWLREHAKYASQPPDGSDSREASEGDAGGDE